MSAYDTNWAAMGLRQEVSPPHAPAKRYPSAMTIQPRGKPGPKKKTAAEKNAAVIAFHPSQCNYAPVPTPSKTIHRGVGQNASI